jgi:pimeloyl-ACP methyl ester carboxylesterase
MPFVEGESLRQRLGRETMLSLSRTVSWVAEIGAGLAFLHAHGIVHRDIKPENIMLSGRHALLTDFGIAKAVSGDVTQALTATGVLIGTPAYMAPEQGVERGDVDERADLYAVGVLGYELLTGRTPFTGTPHQILAAHTARPAAPLSAQRAGIPSPLADAVMRCLQKHPADRWQHAGELLRRLEAVEIGRHPSVEADQPPANLTERAFRISEDVCRKLDRTVLDPRMIGDTVAYLDNNVESDVLVCYLHGTGLDHRDFRQILAASLFRGVAPTLYGCEPDALRRASLPLSAHGTIIWELLQDVVARLRPAATVVVGFSSGGDFAQEMIAGRIPGCVDALITLDCNLSIETCFLTRILAEMSVEAPEQFLAQLRTVGERSTSVGEWVNVHDYLVKILRKFHGDIGPLRRFANELMEPFAVPAATPFVERFVRVSEAVRVVRCVFSDMESNNTALHRIKLDNLDRGVLGPVYDPGCLVTEPGTAHFDLIAADLVGRHVEDVVTRLRVAAPPTIAAQRLWRSDT